MSDEMYGAAGGDDDFVGRYLLTPSPESHVPAMPLPAHDGAPPVAAAATHVVGAPPLQHVPPPPPPPPFVQGGVALLPTAAPPLPPPPPPPPALNLSTMAFGNDDGGVQNHDATMMAMDVQPPPPLQGHQYGFPADGAGAVVPAAGAGLGDHDLGHLPFFDDTLGDSMLQELLGDLSLDDHYSMDEGDSDDSFDAFIKSADAAAAAAAAAAANNDSAAAVAAEHPVSLPVEEQAIAYVPFVAGQLDCSRCRSVREVLHESANHRLFFVVHVGDVPGAFQHAIIDRAYINNSGQTILNELMYADLRGRTHGCAQNFIANTVEVLKNDTSGQLTDSASSASASSASLPQANNAHVELEINMLTELLSATSSNTEAVGVHQSGPEEAPHQTVTRAETNAADDTAVLNAANWPVFSPAILESSQVSVQDGIGMPPSSDASATTGQESLLSKQRRRIAQLTLKDIANLMHMSKKDAAKELDISVTSLKRLCRKNNTDRWPARKIGSLDSKIKKLEQASLRNVGTKGLLLIREKIESLKQEKAQVYASVWKVIQENQRRNNDSAGGSNSGY